MSLLEKVKKGIKSRIEEGKQHRKDKKEIEREAKRESYKTYIKAYREEKLKAEHERIRAIAKRDARGHGGLHGELGKLKGPAISGWNILAGAGKNMLESGQLDFPTVNLDNIGFGSATHAKGKKKKKKTGFELGL